MSFTQTDWQFLATAIRHVRGKSKYLVSSTDLERFEILMAEAKSELGFYATLRNYATLAINSIQTQQRAHPNG